MFSIWYVTTSVKQVTCEHSHQCLRKPFPVHPGVPLLYAQPYIRRKSEAIVVRTNLILILLYHVFHFSCIEIDAHVQ